MAAQADRLSEIADDHQAYEEDYEPTFIPIEELQKHGIGAADITKLRGSGIVTVQGLTMTTVRTLCKIKGFSEAKVDKIKDAAAKLAPPAFQTGLECFHRRAQVLTVTTGSKELDKLLGGGFQSMQLNEVFGEYRTGKTQLAHTLCVTSQLPLSMGGGNGKTAFIDTEGTFRPNRIKEVAERFGVDGDRALENILYARAFNTDQLADLVNELAARFADEAGVYRLLVIDSIIALFRTDFSGRGELAERQQKLNQLLSRLMKLAEEFNVIVYMSNQMQADPAGGMTFVADPKKPVGGHIMSHAATMRLMLRKGRGEQRVGKIVCSADLPEAEAVFSIGSGGIVDATD